MIDIENMCYNCFAQKAGEETCSQCGYNNEQNALHFPTALRAGSVLNGQYIVGRVLGQGGFGITYLALDYNLRFKVAIKEYMPDGMATRLPDSSQMTVYHGEKEENFHYGAERFLDEARVLAKFVGNKNIASVRTYFTENNTSYFVMDFIEGISFKTYLKNQGGHIPSQKAVEILVPVLDALAPVHREGYIHRDVTPDNIYITKENEIKLLDFGSARFSLGNKSKSLDVILKAGYAPKEQYMRRGKQGPYTDIYSIAACFYAAISGYLPPEALERMENDEIVKLGENGIAIEPALEAVILKGLAVQPEERFQSVEDFKAAILEAVGTVRQAPPTVVPPPVAAPEEPPIAAVAAVEASVPSSEAHAVAAQPEAPVAESAKQKAQAKAAPEAESTPSALGIDKIKARLRSVPRKWIYIGSSAAGLLLVLLVVASVTFANRNKYPAVVVAGGPGGTSIPSILDDVPATASAPPVPESSSSTPEPEVEPVDLYTLEYKIPCRFDYAEVFIDGYARIKNGEKWGYINTEGDIIIDPVYESLAYYFDDYVIFRENGRFGYLDRYGDVAIDATYSNAFNFVDGVAAVGGSNGQYFFVNKNGEKIFDDQTFNFASYFADGYAPVATKQGATFIDTSGRVDTRYYEQTKNFSDGFAAVMKNDRWGYVNSNLDLVVPIQYLSAGDFTDGYAVVEDGDGMYHIDGSGARIDDDKWEKAWKYSDGLATIFHDGFYGYTSQATGAVAIEPHYEDVWSFREGLCPVKIDNKWVYIDSSDNIVLDGGWKEAYNFVNSFAKVRKGTKYGLIDLQGNEVVPCDFEEILDYADGLLPVKKNGKWGYYAVVRNTDASRSSSSMSVMVSTGSTGAVTLDNWQTAYLDALEEIFMENNQLWVLDVNDPPDDVRIFGFLRIIESIYANGIPQMVFQCAPYATEYVDFEFEVKDGQLYRPAAKYRDYYMGDGKTTYTVDTDFSDIAYICKYQDGKEVDVLKHDASSTGLTIEEYVRSQGWDLGPPARIVEWEVDELFDSWAEPHAVITTLMDLAQNRFS